MFLINYYLIIIEIYIIFNDFLWIISKEPQAHEKSSHELAYRGNINVLSVEIWYIFVFKLYRFIPYYGGMDPAKLRKIKMLDLQPF